jgi:phage recombination protein Bet
VSGGEVLVSRTAGLTDVVTGGLTDERIELVRRTVAKGATDDELAMFFSLAERYELDPFAKEVWCICNLNRDGSRKLDKYGEPYPAQITASRDGFLAIANRHPAFDGMESDVVCENDDFQRVPNGVVHTYGAAERGKPRGAYALIYRKDRAVPTFFFAKWVEYGEPNLRYDDGKLKTQSPWVRYPSAMILKVAEAMALKRAFSLSGLTAEEELHAGDAIEEGAEAQFRDRPPLSQPKISPASRGLGIGRAHSQPRQPERIAEPVAEPEPELPPTPPEEAYADPDLPDADPDDPNPDDEIPFGENLELPDA